MDGKSATKSTAYTKEQSAAYHASAVALWDAVQGEMSTMAIRQWKDATLAEKLVFQNLAKRDLGYAEEAPAAPPPVTPREMKLAAALKAVLAIIAEAENIAPGAGAAVAPLPAISQHADVILGYNGKIALAKVQIAALLAALKEVRNWIERDRTTADRQTWRDMLKLRDEFLVKTIAEAEGRAS